MIKIALFTAYLLAGICAQAQMQHVICNWDNDRKAAIALTFDDWSPGHSPIVVPQLKSRSLHATFFIPNITASYSWAQITIAYNNGNEIANHTTTHAHLTAKTPAELHAEITQMKAIIEQHYTQSGITFAYPYGEYNPAVLDSVKSSGHLAARGVQPPANYTYNFAATNNGYFNVTTYAMGPSVTAAAFNAQLQKVTAGGGLLTFLYHSVDDATNSNNDTWYSQVKQADFESQLDNLVAAKDVVWVTTFVQAIKYHKEKNCALITQTQAPDGKTWKLNLTDTLSDNTVYNQPLSIKLKKNGVDYTRVTQNGAAIGIDLNRNDSIMFRAVPDQGEIILTADFATSTITGKFAADNITVSPTPNNGIINIHAAHTITPSLVVIYDVQGNRLFTKNNVTFATDLQIDLTGCREGTYLIHIYEDNLLVVKKTIRFN